MEKATTVSGRVVDQDDKPVAGATVVVDVAKGYPKSRQWVDFKFEKTQTDAAGRWSFSGVPDRPDSVALAAYHYSYLSEHNYYRTEDFKPLTALRDGSAIVRLRRGTPVEVMVRSATGQPVAAAEVFYGQGRGYANSNPPGEDGRPGSVGAGDQAGDDLDPVGPGRRSRPRRPDDSRGDASGACRFHASGRPIAEGSGPRSRTQADRGRHGLFFVERPGESATDRRSDQAILHESKTDADGRFAWKNAPARGIRVTAYAPGFGVVQDLVLSSDLDHEIVLTAPTLVKGSVVDATSGQPIPRFTLSHGTVWHAGERLIWQGNDQVDRESKKAPGSFEYTFTYPAHQYILRVSAAGYLPEDSGRFSPDGTPHAFTFRLARGEAIRGTVTTPEGSPADKGFVYLAPAEAEDAIEYLDIWNGKVRGDDRSADKRAKVGLDGRFTFPPQRGNFALVALSDAGFAIVRRNELGGDGRIRSPTLGPDLGLRDAGRQAGRQSRNPVHGPDRPLPVPGEPRIERRYYVKTDAVGRFDLRRSCRGGSSSADGCPTACKAGSGSSTWRPSTSQAAGRAS